MDMYAVPSVTVEEQDSIEAFPLPSGHRYLDGIFTILQGKQRSSTRLRRQRPPAAK